MMKTKLTLAVGMLLLAVVRLPGQPTESAAIPPTELETRCGWFSNPTPGNAWLYDRDAEWTISVQGGYEAKGDWPEFKPQQWVETNGNYGYGCACLQVKVNRRTHEVVEIKSGRPRPVSQCRKDPALKKWNRKLQ